MDSSADFKIASTHSSSSLSFPSMALTKVRYEKVLCFKFTLHWQYSSETGSQPSLGSWGLSVDNSKRIFSHSLAVWFSIRERILFFSLFWFMAFSLILYLFEAVYVTSPFLNCWERLYILNDKDGIKYLESRKRSWCRWQCTETFAKSL